MTYAFTSTAREMAAKLTAEKTLRELIGFMSGTARNVHTRVWWVERTHTSWLLLCRLDPFHIFDHRRHQILVLRRDAYMAVLVIETRRE